MRSLEILALALPLMACQPSVNPEITVESLAIDHPAQFDQPCVPFDRLTFAPNENGELAYFENSEFTGKACSFHGNGQIWTSTSYEQGMKQGLWQVFYENGQIEKEGRTADGKEDGKYLEYYADGKLKYDYTYAKGQKIGIWKSWYADGTHYTERHFEADQLDGKVLVWDDTGKLAKEYDYVHGKLVNSIMHFKQEN